MLGSLLAFCLSTTVKIWVWILEALHLKSIILFFIKKGLCYGFFCLMAFSIIIRAYLQYIPSMDQTVKIQYHLINEKYYGFVFDSSFKLICDAQESDIITINFQQTQLKFQRSFICGAVIHEENNQLIFQDEYYEIRFNIDANYLLPHQKTIVELTSYLVSEESYKNFKQQNLIKLGEQYHFSLFKFLPFRIIVKLYNKMAEFLDLNDSYQKTGDIDLFSHIPNQNTKIKAIILEMVAYEAAEFQSEIKFIPMLTGIRYYLYYYFYSTLFFGTFLFAFFFVFCWEVCIESSVGNFQCEFMGIHFKCDKNNTYFFKRLMIYIYSGYYIIFYKSLYYCIKSVFNYNLVFNRFQGQIKIQV